MKKLRKLNARQQRFCEEYVKEPDTAAAYMKVYKCSSEYAARKNGGALLRTDPAREYIDQLEAERRERTKVSADYIINNLREIVERCMSHKPVMVYSPAAGGIVQRYDEHGNNIWKFEPFPALRALEMLAKYTGMKPGENNLKAPLPLPIIKVYKCGPPVAFSEADVDMSPYNPDDYKGPYIEVDE